jgi:hypothetical protein
MTHFDALEQSGVLIRVAGRPQPLGDLCRSPQRPEGSLK